jgi:VWFA-related protein
MRLRCVVILGSSFLLTLGLLAQAHTESMTVEVVDVPVFVTRGNTPVEGLSRENFELYVNGRRQSIDYFEELSPAREGATLRERRLFLLLFDITFSHPHSLWRAQRAAARLIADAPAGDFFGVATYSSRRGVWIAAPFTDDHETLLHAIGSLSNPHSGDPLALVMTSVERASLRESSSFGGSQGIADEALRDMYRARLYRAAEDQVESLTELADRLASLDGQKHVIVMSEGFEGRSPNPWSIDRVSSPTTFNANGTPTFSLARTPTPWLTTPLFSRLSDLYRSCHKADVFLHAIDIEGVAWTWVADDGLNMLTSGTGGKYIHSRNDLGAALADLSSSVSRGYRLGFRPANVRRGDNRITVKVAGVGRGARVRHRRGFSGTPEAVKVDDGLYLADVLQNDVSQTGTAATLEHRDGTLLARIPLREVAAQLAGDGNAELLVYAFAADGKALIYRRAVIPVSAGATGEETIEIAMPKGAQEAKALLRVDGSLGFSRIAL